MTTDQLITLLVADLKPVDRGRILRAVIIALAIGAAAAFGVMLLIFGRRTEMLDTRNLDFLLIKLLFAFGVVVTAAIFLPQSARPGAQTRNSSALIFAPFVAIATAAAMALGSAHFSGWAGMIVEKDSFTCLPSIPLLAVLPFTALIWALRMGASTDRTRAGEIAGLVAGGLGALACASGGAGPVRFRFPMALFHRGRRTASDVFRKFVASNVTDRRFSANSSVEADLTAGNASSCGLRPATNGGECWSGKGAPHED